jgi:3-oxoadipate enol-lactonase
MVSLQPTAEGFVRCGRGRLGYRVFGAPVGQPLLLVRPLGGSMTLWTPLLRALDASTRVVAFDPAGVGRSASIPARTRVDAMVDDAERVLDEVGVARAVVLGQSLGGFVAMRLAAIRPARVARLVLASTALRGLSFSRPPVLRGLLSARCLLCRTREVEVCLLRHTLSPHFARTRPEAVREIEDMLRAEPVSRRTFLRQDLAASRYDGRADVRRIVCPVQLLTGAADGLLGTAAQYALAGSLGVPCTVIRDVGHDLSLEAPDALAGAVAQVPGSHAS